MCLYPKWLLEEIIEHLKHDCNCDEQLPKNSQLRCKYCREMGNCWSERPLNERPIK